MATRGRMRRAVALLIAVALVALGIGIGAAPATASPLPTISGSVVDASLSVGIANVTLSLYDANSPDTALSQTSSNSSGSYSFVNVPDGTYFVKTQAGGYATQQSTNYVVSGSNVVIATFELSHLGTLSGTVNNYNGTAAITVLAGFWSSGNSWIEAGTGTVQPDGTFSVPAVTDAGSYDLEFEVQSYAVPQLTTWYGDMVQAPYPPDSSSGVISATASENVANLTVTLAAAGYITGVVTSGGKAVSGVDVDAFDNVLQNEFDAVAPSSSTGAYKIKVPAGVPLQIETDGAAPYEYQTWNGHNGCGCTYDPVTVTPGATKTGINFALLKSPVELEAIVLLDSGGSSDPAFVPGGTLHLYEQVTGGYKLLESQTTDPSTGEADFEVPAGQNLRLRVSGIDSSTNKVVWLPIEFYVVATESNTNPTPVIPDSPVCFVDVPAAQPNDEEAVFMAVTPDTTLCGPEPAIKKHTGSPTTLGNAGSASTTASTVTSAPTPTPTPTPTDTATPTPSPNPVHTSAPVAAPKPAPASSDSGLPWWIWLLIVVGILILIGVGVVIFRVRR